MTVELAMAKWGMILGIRGSIPKQREKMGGVRITTKSAPNCDRWPIDKTPRAMPRVNIRNRKAVGLEVASPAPVRTLPKSNPSCKEVCDEIRHSPRTQIYRCNSGPVK